MRHMADASARQLLGPKVHLLRPTRRKRGVQPAAPLPDFEPFTVDDFRLSTGGLEPHQVRLTSAAAQLNGTADLRLCMRRAVCGFSCTGG